MKVFLESSIPLIVSVWLMLSVNGQNETSNAVQESKQFNMELKSSDYQRHSDNNTVVRAGKVLTDWSSRCWKSRDAGCNTCSFTEYTDQLCFQFSYDSIKNFNFQYPTIKSSGGRAKAEIMDYSHDLDERNGEIIITHNCEPAKQKAMESSSIELLFPLTNDNILEIGWKKQCGYGDHEKLDYGIVSRRKGTQYGEISLKWMSKDDQAFVFGPAVLSTRVYLKHKEDGYSQRFSSPVVRISGLQREGGIKAKRNGLTVDVKGSGFGDIVLGKTSSVFDVFYNCHERGLWKIEVTVKIVPFNELKMKWMKDCGGGAETQINVATRIEDGLADVVSEGITLEKFGSRTKGNEKGVVSGKGSGTKVFFLWMKELNRSMGSISIGAISAHSYNDKIGKARIARIDKIYERARWGIAGIGEDGETIDGGAKRIIGVRVDCRRKGKVKISVRLSVHDRDEIEWWFYNKCDKPGQKKNKQLYLTAGTVTYIMMSLLCGMMVATVRHGSKTNTQKL